jgi:hypothetical protein
VKDFLNRLNIEKLQDFHTRQKLLSYFLAVISVIALFYWTQTIISTKRADMQAATVATKERIIRVQGEIQKLQDKQQNVKLLSTGLQSYIQIMGQNMGISAKFVNIKLINSVNRQEQVSFRSENLVYKDLSAILQDFEQYDNIWVKSVYISKRFDNPKRLDIAWDIVRAIQ